VILASSADTVAATVCCAAVVTTIRPVASTEPVPASNVAPDWVRTNACPAGPTIP
jgi:hypothetical protein